MSAHRQSQPTPQRLFAWMLADPRTPRLIGEAVRLANGDVGFTYAEQWLAAGFRLDPGMMLAAEQIYRPTRGPNREPLAAGAINDARPDRWGEKVIRYLHKSGATLFDYLYFAGDERFGAIGISSSSEQYLPYPQGPLPRLRDADDLNQAAAIINSGEGELAEQQGELIRIGASLGGAKPKAVIEIDGTAWVLKLPNGEHIDQALAEHATLLLAKKAGINVAESRLVTLRDGHALAVARFDRVAGQRVHCLSAQTLLQSIAAEPASVDYGYPHLARALRQYANPDTLADQQRELFRRMVFNILLCNTDDHERNHVLCMDGNYLNLSPAFDVVPTMSGATAHEFLIGDSSHAPTLANAMSSFASFGLSAPEAAAEVARIIAVVDDWQTHFSALGVSPADLREIATHIDSDSLLAERREFDVAHYAEAKPKKPRSGARIFKGQ